MKLLLSLTVFLIIGFSFSGCSLIPSPLLWSNSTPKSFGEEGDRQDLGSSSDFSCKKSLDKAMKNFDPQLPVMGSDLDPLVNIISEYQSCENVKRDDRIAEVLLKLLTRVQVLEGELSSIKGGDGSDVSAGQ